MIGFIKRFFRAKYIESLNLTNDFKVEQSLCLLDDKYIDILRGNNTSGLPYFIEFELIADYTKGLEASTFFSKEKPPFFPDGRFRIFINPRNADAPVQALAALIAHETTHQDKDNSIEEEYQAFYEEIKVWKKLKIQSEHPLVERLNTIEKAYDNSELMDLIKSLPAYRGLAI